MYTDDEDEDEDEDESRFGSTVDVSAVLGCLGGKVPSGLRRLGFMMRFGAPPDPTTSGNRISMYSS